MGAYDLVPQALRETGKTFRDILSHEATGRVDRAQMGLAKTKLGYDLQQHQRKIFMNTPDTVENIVNNLPGLSPDQKQRLLNTPQYQVMHKSGIITTPKQIGNVTTRIREEKAKQAREDEVSSREFEEGLIDNFTLQSVENYRESRTSENKRGNLGLLKRAEKKRETLTLQQRQKQVGISIKEQLSNKLLNDQSIKDAIYNGTATAASVAKDPSAYLTPDGFKLYQKTKSLASKYSKDMPIQEAIQKAETEAQTSTGDDLIRKFVTIKNPEERKAFAQNLKESDLDLYAIFLEASKRYDAGEEKKTMKDKNYPSDWKGGLINMRQP